MAVVTSGCSTAAPVGARRVMGEVANGRYGAVPCATRAPYRMSYIAVITVRNNEIALYRDYWSPAAAADVLGGTQELLTAFTGSTHE